MVPTDETRTNSYGSQLGPWCRPMKPGPILIMAGGTGGHVYPALAVARALQQQSREIVWLGTHRGLESRVIPDAGIPIEWVAISGLRGKGLPALLLAPFKLILPCHNHST